jgi:hypothetical protein
MEPLIYIFLAFSDKIKQEEAFDMPLIKPVTASRITSFITQV